MTLHHLQSALGVNEMAAVPEKAVSIHLASFSSIGT